MICAAVSTRRYCDGQTDRQMDTLWRHVRAMHRKQEAQLSQRGRACFVFICSQLQHTYSAGFLLLVTAASDLSVYKILLNSVLLSPIVSGGVRPTPPPDKHPYVITPLFYAVRGQLGSGPPIVNWIGSGVRISVSFQQKYPPGFVLRCPTAAVNGVMTKRFVSGDFDLRLRQWQF